MVRRGNRMIAGRESLFEPLIILVDLEGDFGPERAEVTISGTTAPPEELIRQPRRLTVWAPVPALATERMPFGVLS